MEDGVIAEKGSHNELLKQDGQYKRLISRQLQNAGGSASKKRERESAQRNKEASPARKAEADKVVENAKSQNDVMFTMKQKQTEESNEVETV